MSSPESQLNGDVIGQTPEDLQAYGVDERGESEIIDHVPGFERTASHERGERDVRYSSQAGLAARAIGASMSGLSVTREAMSTRHAMPARGLSVSSKHARRRTGSM